MIKLPKIKIKKISGDFISRLLRTTLFWVRSDYSKLVLNRQEKDYVRWKLAQNPVKPLQIAFNGSALTGLISPDALFEHCDSPGIEALQWAWFVESAVQNLQISRWELAGELNV